MLQDATLATRRQYKIANQTHRSLGTVHTVLIHGRLALVRTADEIPNQANSFEAPSVLGFRDNNSSYGFSMTFIE
jgi:hypothetical protein